MAKFVLDPGHGGTKNEGGSSWNNARGPGGTLEKDLTLDVGLEAQAILVGRGHLVRMTRATDKNLGLAGRAAVAKRMGADAFVSIHFNGWHTPDVQGTETYHYPNASPASVSLAEQVQGRMLAATRLRDRGVKAGSYGVLRPDRHARETAACLLEVSFLTDPGEERRLKTKAYPTAIATAIADGIEAHMGIISDAPESIFIAQAALEMAEGNLLPDLGDAVELHQAIGFAFQPVSAEPATAEAASPRALISLEPDFYQEPPSTDVGVDASAHAGGIPDPRNFAKGFQTKTPGPEIQIDELNTRPFPFLQQGHLRGRAVCRIQASGLSYDGRWGSWNGTGVLVGGNLLLTNHHVLNTPEVAREAVCQFEYEQDLSGRLKSPRQFRLDPDRLFITSPYRRDPGEGLDYTFVAIDSAAESAYDKVQPQRGFFAISEGDRANIIHHPNGDPKTISIEENEVVRLDTALVYYTSDTEPGSSGSPVFDDSWRLTALHHASRGNRDGWTDAKGRTPHYLNEGIKFSAITLDLETIYGAASESAERRAAANEVLGLIGGSDSVSGYFGALGRKPHREEMALERVVSIYKGAASDVDIAFWNLEWFNRRYQEDPKRLDEIATIIADLNLDIWAFEETSPEATEVLVDRLKERFGLRFEHAASEPDAPPAKQTTSVIWNVQTVEGRRREWPDEIRKWLEVDSRKVSQLGLEAAHGKVFDRFPGLFRFSVLGREADAAFDFNLVPVHLKAMAEGHMRRRMASIILSAAVQRMIDEHGADDDWIIGGDFNAELASRAFAALLGDGFEALSARDEEDGAMTYLKRPNSLIDHIFLSPTLSRAYGPDDFFIYAKNETKPRYAKEISDHLPVLVRLGITPEAPRERRPATLPAGLEEVLDRLPADMIGRASASPRTASGDKAEGAGRDGADRVADLIREVAANPAGLLRALAERLDDLTQDKA